MAHVSVDTLHHSAWGKPCLYCFEEAEHLVRTYDGELSSTLVCPQHIEEASRGIALEDHIVRTIQSTNLPLPEALVASFRLGAKFALREV